MDEGTTAWGWVIGGLTSLAIAIVGIMRTLIIGDVHGCKDELLRLVESFGFVPGVDRLFQVGDLINKGPDTAGCIELVQKLGIRCILGNHEAKLLKVLAIPEGERSERERNYLSRLGPRVFEIGEAIRSWPLWIEEPDFLLVHAGLEPGKTDLREMRRKSILTIRTWDGVGEELDLAGDPHWYECVQWPKTVVFGHWAMLGLVERPGFRGLDTGCVYGGKLTGWCPEEDRIYQVDAAREYVHLQPGVLT